MTEENTKVKLVGQTNDSSHRSQVADLTAKLDRELELRRIDVQAKTEMERKLEEMEKKMDLMRQGRENAMFIANERATWARMTEVCSLRPTAIPQTVMLKIRSVYKLLLKKMSIGVSSLWSRIRRSTARTCLRTLFRMEIRQRNGVVPATRPESHHPTQNSKLPRMG